MHESRIEARRFTTPTFNFIAGHEEVYPSSLAARYPYILEKLAAIWSKPDEARAYFQELLVTQRESRQGFPMGVYMEIFALSEHYNQRNPLSKHRDDDFWTWVKPGA